MSDEIHLKLQGSMIDLWECLDQEILAEGPAGTAKTRTILEMLDYIARKYAEARILIVRKSRASMTHSVMHTYEHFVMQRDVYFHTTNQEYRYPNGSVLAVGGFDKAAKLLSSEWDIIYCNEATELSEDEWETLTTRLRSSVVPYQQLIADCNPDVDTHWLNQRAATDRMARIVTRHEDNPLYWDAEQGRYTPEGERYVKGVLDRLTGVRLLRYRKGIWAAREGLVYDEFDRAVHVIKREDLPHLPKRYRAIDFGFSNAFVCLWAGEDHDGRLYIYREIYHTQRTVRVHSRQINKLSAGETYAAKAICDHDAEDRATLKENGIQTLAAHKSIRQGIDAVMERLKIQGDGKPRLYIVEDALVEMDQSLRDAGLPTCTLEELGSYSWPDTKADRNADERPIDAYNHGCLVGDTQVYTPSGSKSLRDVLVGDYVLGRNGFVPVTDAAMTQESAAIYCVILANGAVLRGTYDHPVWTSNKGYTQLDALRYGDMLEYNVSRKENALCSQNHTSRAERKLSFIRASNFAVIPKLGNTATRFILCLALQSDGRELIDSIANYTKTLLGKFRKGMRSIIKTGIHSTMIHPIWNACLVGSIPNITAKICPMPNAASAASLFYAGCYHSPKNGIDPKKGERGTVSTPKRYSGIGNQRSISANTAEGHMSPGSLPTTAFVVTTAKPQPGETAAWTTKPEFANAVVRNLSATSTGKSYTVPVPVLSVFATNKKQPVYNLTVDGGEYFADGVLVHNCDALRYLTMHVDQATSRNRKRSREY